MVLVTKEGMRLEGTWTEIKEACNDLGIDLATLKSETTEKAPKSKKSKKNQTSPRPEEKKTIYEFDFNARSKTAKFKSYVPEALWRYNHKVALECNGEWISKDADSCWKFSKKEDFEKFKSESKTWIPNKEYKEAKGIKFKGYKPNK